MEKCVLKNFEENLSIKIIRIFVLFCIQMDATIIVNKEEEKKPIK